MQSLNFQMGYALISFAVSVAVTANAQLPRIGVRQGTSRAEFFNTQTGRVFLPEGNSYYNNHCEFHPGVYNPADAESQLAQMRLAGGYNVVRVFIANGRVKDAPCAAIDGVGGNQSSATPGLSAAYMGNFADFLTRAMRHRIYVIPVLAWIPYTSYYVGLATPPLNLGLSRIGESEHVNSFYLFGGAVEAKKQYAQQFILALRAMNPALLSVIFAYEIENEVHMRSDLAPFDRFSGSVKTADGLTYDMANPASRQQCMDANSVYWATTVANGIRAIDPNALVTASVYTYGAAGKPGGPNGVITPSNIANTSHPARPLVFAFWARALSYLDIHLYPSKSYDMDADLRTSEFASIPANTPLLLGEFGPDAMGFPAPWQAATELGRTRTAAYQRRFLGALLWTWNVAKLQNGAVNGVLAPVVRATASSTHSSTMPFYAFDGDPGTSWNSGTFAPAWIQQDLGRVRTISSITLTPNQNPAGVTHHEIYGGTRPDHMTRLGTIYQYTEMGKPVTVSFTPRQMQFIKVHTHSSPSWISWSEIAVQDSW